MILKAGKKKIHRSSPPNNKIDDKNSQLSVFPFWKSLSRWRRVSPIGDGLKTHQR
jgi:hypothetical protein